MRILFVTETPTVAAQIAENYGGVEIVGVVRSYSDGVRIASGAASGGHPVEVLVAMDSISDPIDRAAGYDLGRLIGSVKSTNASSRLVVLSLSGELTTAAADLGATMLRITDRGPVDSAIAELLALAPKSEIARVITVTGLQGGAGRTTIAQMLAFSLGEKRRPGTKGVLLWEIDLKHPTLGFQIEVDLVSAHHGRRTIAGLLNGEPINRSDDPRVIAPYIIPAESGSKLPYDVLLAPHGIREVMNFFKSNRDLNDLAERLRVIIEIARRAYAYIIIDTGTDFFYDPAPAVAIGAADAVCIVATPCAAGLSSVTAARHLIGDLRRLDSTRLVLNRLSGDPANRRYTAEIAPAAGGIALAARIDEGQHLTLANYRALFARIAAIWTPTAAPAAPTASPAGSR